MSKLLLEQEDSKTFEITIALRDSQGNPTGRTKTFKTDSAYKLWKFYMNHQGKPKRRKKSGNPKNLPNQRQAEKIMKDMYKADDGE